MPPVSLPPSTLTLPPVRVPRWLWRRLAAQDYYAHPTDLLPRVRCRRCGDDATQEECIVKRPGRPTVEQTVVRCRHGCPPVVVELPL